MGVTKHYAIEKHKEIQTYLFHTCIKRIVNGNGTYFSHLQLFRSNLPRKRTEVELYKTLARPVIAYEAETRTLRATDELALRILERRIMRRLYGPIFAQENDK
jgi:hypothetical protein